jgi:GST-like protein
MIDLYTFSTPNGRKISIMLEETNLPYQTHVVDIRKNEQFTPEFLRINPNNKIPAIVDHQGPDNKSITLFESGAILIYLAEKTGQFLAADKRQRALTLQWLMFQISGIGPMLGQAHHFLHYAPESVPYAIERYTKEANRLYSVLNNHLMTNEFLANDYSIADIAAYPWISYHKNQNIDIDTFPHVKQWLAKITARPAVQKGMQIPYVNKAKSSG